jgi:uncharacterized OB-fold protein
MIEIVPPIAGADDEFFWEGARRGVLLLQQCGSCGTLRNPPTLTCSACNSMEFATHAVSGRGTLSSWIVSRQPSEATEPPRIVALIDLEEGPRLVSNLIDIEVSEIRNDMAVEVCFVEHGSGVLPQFRPANVRSVKEHP